jgi:hypothetical protein
MTVDVPAALEELPSKWRPQFRGTCGQTGGQTSSMLRARYRDDGGDHDDGGGAADVKLLELQRPAPIGLAPAW